MAWKLLKEGALLVTTVGIFQHCIRLCFIFIFFLFAESWPLSSWVDLQRLVQYNILPWVIYSNSLFLIASFCSGLRIGPGALILFNKCLVLEVQVTPISFKIYYAFFATFAVVINLNCRMLNGMDHFTRCCKHRVLQKSCLA